MAALIKNIGIDYHIFMTAVYEVLLDGGINSSIDSSHLMHGGTMNQQVVMLVTG